MEGEKINFSDINMIVLDNMPEKESERQVYMISLSRAAKHFYGVMITILFDSAINISMCVPSELI